MQRHADVFVSSPTMLITDDDDAFRETLRSAFAPRGFNTLLASNGDEALEIVHREPVHLLLTDMHMPRMTGLEIIRQIRRSRLLLPCILISANVDEGLAEELREAQAFSILSKPVRFSEVLGVVRDAMRAAYGWTSGLTDGADSDRTN